MIYESDRDNFALLLRVTWQSNKRNAPDRETMRYWFDKLISYEFSVVANAFDRWLIAQDELPTVKDILRLCQPETPIYNAIAHKVDVAENKKRVKEVVSFVAENLKQKSDKKAWARKIMANPSQYSDYSFKCAKEALNEV